MPNVLGDQSNIAPKVSSQQQCLMFVDKSSQSSKNNLKQATRIGAANKTEYISGVFEGKAGDDERRKERAFTGWQKKISF